MDNLEYLNQISVKPSASFNPSGGSLLDNKLVRIILVSLVVITILVVVLVSAFPSSSEPAELTDLKTLYSRVDNLATASKTYSPLVKNSTLRSSGSSLSVILANSQNDFSSLLSSGYGVDAAKLTPSKTLTAEFTELTDSLEKARLNGILDRIYANEFSYQLSVILILEASIYEKTDSEQLKNAVDSSYSSLEKLKDDFSKFSEGSN